LFILRLLAPLLLALLAYWGLIKLQRRYSLNRRQFRWLVGLTAALLVVMILIIMGRLPVQALAAPLIFLLTFVMRNGHWLMQLASMLRGRKNSAWGPTGRSAGNGTSSIRTAWLAMELAHSSGKMDGEVLDGQFKGKQLSELDLQQLLILAAECEQDADSLQLLEAYLDRVHPDWHAQAEGQAAPTAGSDMTEALALEILGLEPGAGVEEITAAHRRLMQKMHPDRGGSDYLAQRINEARDFLLD
tara:strand:- start:90659 stop:91393 length:735 start_codon:yes stop_codon:yes gene_type:complete